MSPSFSAQRSTATGFTLIELLVVLTISAILLAVAVPSFNGSIARARVSDAANSLLASVELARAEAVRRGATVTLCRVLDPSAALPVCSTAASGTFAAGDWASGWVVFMDGGAVGTLEAGDQIIRIEPAIVAGGARAQILGNPAPVGPISFRADGLSEGGGAAFTVSYPQTAMGVAVATRGLNMTVVGQVTTTP